MSGAASNRLDRAITGVIVAGGASSRFDGQPKGLARVGGQRIIDRVVAALKPVVGSIALVSNAPDADTWLKDTPTWRDERSERASIVGIHTALLHEPNVLVVAWDMPFLTVELMRAIVTRFAAGVSAVIPEGPGGPEALCALYTRDCLAAIEAALDANTLRMSRVLDQMANTVRIPLKELEPLGDPARLFFNVNTPDDLRTAEELAHRD